jgi:hypothetical protein
MSGVAQEVAGPIQVVPSNSSHCAPVRVSSHGFVLWQQAPVGSVPPQAPTSEHTLPSPSQLALGIASQSTWFTPSAQPEKYVSLQHAPVGSGGSQTPLVEHMVSEPAHTAPEMVVQSA